MSKLTKFIEFGAYGKQTGRVAYVLRPSTLPDPHKGFEWAVDASFNAEEAILTNVRLKDILRAAIRDGYAIVRE
jgi:hypothetical protein